MKIHRDALDILFAKYIKARDKYCQRCGNPSSLQTAHFFGRRNQNTRFDPMNACLLCFNCHMHFHENPLEFTEWFREHIGYGEFFLLRARAQETGKPDREAIRLWLKQELKILEDLR